MGVGRWTADLLKEADGVWFGQAMYEFTWVIESAYV